MIPSAQLSTNIAVSEDIQTTITYNLTEDKIQGSSDNIEALQQAIYKVLNTEKYECPIYSFSYGIELEDLIGSDAIYVKAELKRRITECLTQDDRITSVDNFIFTATGDNLLCVFDVLSIYGVTTITKEVEI
jgi:hypothetical protein